MATQNEATVTMETMKKFASNGDEGRRWGGRGGTGGGWPNDAVTKMGFIVGFRVLRASEKTCVSKLDATLQAGNLSQLRFSFLSTEEFCDRFSIFGGSITLTSFDDVLEKSRNLSLGLSFAD